MTRRAATKSDLKRSEAAWEAFHHHHASQWGPERWRESLYPFLAKSQHYVALMNEFAPAQDFKECLQPAGIQFEELDDLQFPSLTQNALGHSTMRCLANRRAGNGTNSFPSASQTTRDSNSSPALLSHWNMDAASALIAHLLDVRPGYKVLDMCAAPGGKSVALAQNLFKDSIIASPNPSSSAGSGCLHCNEIDPGRNARLAANLKAYLPQSLSSTGSLKLLRVDATSVNAPELFPASGQYDRILVDAPCSAERHMIHAYNRTVSAGQVSDDIMRWRPQSSGKFAKVQVALLANALRMARMHGRILYATCSIEAIENDGVVEKTIIALAKLFKNEACGWSTDIITGSQATPPLAEGIEEWAETTKYGHIVLPDHGSKGRWGPLYFSVLEKKPS